MSIRVVCPHCEEEFNLQDDLRGKGMRCPECRKTFVVQSADPPPSAPAPIIPIPVAPPPEPLLAGNVADFVPVLEADPASRPTLEVPYQRVETEVIVPMLDEPSPIVGQPEPLESVSSIEVIVPDLVNEAPTPKRSPSKPKSPSGPKEVDWRSEAPPILDAEPVQATPNAADKPSAPTKPKIRHEFDPDRYRQRRGTGPWKYVLLFLVVSIFGMGAYIGVQSILNRINLEKNLASTAFDEFKKSNFTESMKIYDELLEKFPTSEKRANYEFFRKLTTLHTLVSAVTIRDNPAEGVAKWDEFLKEYSDSPLVKPDENGYGYDVFEAGRKLIDAHADHVENNLKTFVPNRKDRGLLDKSEKAVDVGRKLIPVVDRYRIKEVMPLDEKRKRFDDLTGKLTRERERLAVIDPFRDLPKTPTDVRIAQFAASLKQARFETDTEALQIIDDAKAELRKLIRFFVDEKPSIPPPIDAAAGKIFVSAPLGESQVPIIVAPDAVLETFFAVVRGIVYAFDPDSGNLLWAARVGKAAFDSPAKVPERNGQPELVLIPTDLDGFGLTARVARSGQPKWYQPLAAPIAGRPIVIGTRIYVPLQDDAGTIVELEAGSGNRLGYLTLRQRIGAGAVRLGGTSLLYVLAEARRVFVIDVEPSNATGDRLPMRCLQVLATEHPDLSVKVPPILTGPIGEQRATRFLLLAQSDGVNSTRMRAFSLLPPAAYDPKVGPREVAPPLAASQAIPGHVWYAPHSDGERVAIVTDAGSFNLFGTNQDGNLDANLFAIPSAQLPTDLQNPIAGQVLSAEEDTYWAITRSKRYRLKLGVGVGVGLQAATVGLPLPLGIPMQTAQLTTTRDTAFLVVRSEEADGARAVAFDTRDGRMKWTRKLGVTSPVSPIVLGTTAVVIDEDGGVVVLNESDAKGTEATPIARGQLLAQPVTRPAAPALPCVTPDGKTVWVLAPERGDKESLSMRIRKVADGKASLDVLVALQPNAKPVSPAIVVGNGVVFAAADGNLYRYEVGNPKLIQGPTWRGDGVPPTEPCWLVPYSATEFLMTDGGKTVSRFRWPEEKDFKLVAGPWALRDRIAFSPLALPNDKRIVLADGLGNVLLYDADAVGEPLRRWRSNDTIPPGTPTMVLSAMGNKDSLVLVIAIDGKHLVGVTPDSDDALWVVKRPNGVEFLGGTVVGDVVVMTDQAGTLTSYEAATGGKLGSVRPENAELLPRSHAVPFTAKLMALPALDGSVVFLRFIGK